MDVHTANGLIYHYYFDVLGFCGCWEPGAVLDELNDGLKIFSDETMNNWDERWKFAEEHVTMTYLIHTLGLTTHGGSIVGSWLTDKSKKLLEILDMSNENWQNLVNSAWPNEESETAFLKVWK